MVLNCNIYFILIFFILHVSTYADLKLNIVNVSVAYSNFPWCKIYANDIRDFVLLQLRV